MDVIPKLPSIYDEPFADSSQIPTHLISRLARKHVTVALTGDGGDELFAGYNRYILGKKHWELLKSLPKGLRKALSGAMGLVGGKRFENIYRMFEFALPVKSRISLPREKYDKVEKIMSMTGIDEVYKRLVSINYMPERYLVSEGESFSRFDDLSLWNHSGDYVENMQKFDLLTYLPDDLLVKVDRAAMAVNLETRVPFLDHELVEFVMSLPLDFKLKNGQGKYLLRKVLYRHVSEEIMERPKMGFTVPLGDWLTGPLRDWALELIESKRLDQEGYFKSDPVMNMWNEHSDGRANWGHQLWNILMFQSWLESNN
jgi:asparagine synthase (glutamine-hydrolysing)